jgi:hypothetical protein
MPPTIFRIHPGNKMRRRTAGEHELVQGDEEKGEGEEDKEGGGRGGEITRNRKLKRRKRIKK